jgi:hypothetical protein
MWAAKYVSSAIAGEKIPEQVKSKTFYDLKAPLPGSKGVYDFVSQSDVEIPIWKCWQADIVDRLS